MLLFLDVQMPELDGFGVIATLVAAGPGAVPAVVFVTAHDEYALRAFDAHAVDYLLKPFSDERFEAALDRASATCAPATPQALLSRMQALLGARPRRPSATRRPLARTAPAASIASS